MQNNQMKLIFRQHAIKRMHERCITEEEVEHTIKNGTIIESYPDDTPYASFLLLGYLPYNWAQCVPSYIPTRSMETTNVGWV